jgi:hypothetical protein
LRIRYRGERHAGIAKVTLFGRENIVIIRGRENGLTLRTMSYSPKAHRSGANISKDLKAKEAKSTTSKHDRSPLGADNSSLRSALALVRTVTSRQLYKQDPIAACVLRR